MQEIILKKGKEELVKRKHPWIFSGAIQGVLPDLGGSVVKVVDFKNNFLCLGHYQANGSIAVRILSYELTDINVDFWTRKLNNAFDYRKQMNVLNADTNVFRLLHGEGDGLSGLIVDIYADTAVLQSHSLGMYNARYAIAKALQAVNGLSLKRIYFKPHALTNTTSAQEGEWLLGEATEAILVKENGLTFEVNVVDGQKTGFFVDQRENRHKLRSWVNGKKVLNTFCYTGGFSVYAAAGGAIEVASVDVSARATAVAKKNLDLNGFTDAEKYSVHTMDTFNYLDKCGSEYDVIVLDPPAFAKHLSARHQAVKGYKRLNVAALKVIKSGGLLLTFSCSQVVNKQLFYDTIVAAAIESGRNVKVVDWFSQPADHPVSIFHPEGDYLKGLVLYVE